MSTGTGLSEKGGPLFTTFRLHDNSNNESNDDGLSRRKRLRTTLSCNECHKSKVKCDRRKPCTRCLLAGREKQCTYRSDYSTSAIPMQPTQNSGNSAQSYYHRKEDTSAIGRTHWASVICEDAAQYIFGQVPDFQDTFQLLIQLKDQYPQHINSNFPFNYGTPSQRSAIMENLPPFALLHMLVENYLNTFEQMYPLIDSRQFKEELSEFQTNPCDRCDTWFAQLLMMLSLSCNAADEQILNEFGREESEHLGKRCLQWAATTLGSATPAYMDFPDLHSIRTLCMMVIAKSADAETPTSGGGLWALEGFMVRSAMSMSLHRDPSGMPEIPIFEANNRRQIWNTIVFLDLSVAIDSGLPATIKLSDWNAAPPSRIENENVDNHTEFFQNMLARAYPVIALVISWINSPMPEMTYNQVLDCNNQIRTILRDANSAFVTRLSATDINTANGGRVILIQQTMLNVFLRRTLLALHQHYDRAHFQQVEFATSHWSVLECSLALLHSQHKLYERIDQSPSMIWFADFFQSDFAIAMLHVISGLRRQSFSDMPTNNEEVIENVQNEAPHSMAQKTARTALQTSFEIVKMSAGRSFHLFKVLLGVGLSIAALEASESDSPLAEAMENAARSIIDIVKQSRAK